MSASGPRPPPPHTARAREIARQQARAATAGRRRAIALVCLAALLACAVVNPRWFGFAAAGLLCGWGARWLVVARLPGYELDAGSSRAPRRVEHSESDAERDGRALLAPLVLLGAGLGLLVWLTLAVRRLAADAPLLAAWADGGAPLTAPASLLALIARSSLTEWLLALAAFALARSIGERLRPTRV